MANTLSNSHLIAKLILSFFWKIFICIQCRLLYYLMWHQATKKHFFWQLANYCISGCLVCVWELLSWCVFNQTCPKHHYDYGGWSRLERCWLASQHRYTDAVPQHSSYWCKWSWFTALLHCTNLRTFKSSVPFWLVIYFPHQTSLCLC